MQSDRDVLALALSKITAVVDGAKFNRADRVFEISGPGLEKLSAAKAYLSGILTRAPDPDVAALCVAVEKIETVTVDSLMQEPGDPIWRIEIDGFCIDFDFEQAANNVAGAINARLESLSRQLSDAQRERDELRAAVSEWLRYRNSMLSGDWDTQAGERAAAKKLESMVEHTEGGKP